MEGSPTSGFLSRSRWIAWWPSATNRWRPRGTEQLERLTLAWEVVSNLALRLRMVNRRGTWSAAYPGGELHADQVDYTLGAQYTVGW